MARAVVPGTDTQEEKQAAVELMQTELSAVLQQRDVFTMSAKLSMTGARSLARLAVLKGARPEMRQYCKDALGVDHTDVDGAVKVAALIKAWEAAQLRTAARCQAEAEAAATNSVPQVERSEHLALEAKLLSIWGKQEDSRIPLQSSLNYLFDQAGKGEFKDPLL